MNHDHDYPDSWKQPFLGTLDQIECPIVAVLCHEFEDRYLRIEWHLGYCPRSYKPWFFQCGEVDHTLTITAITPRGLVAKLSDWTILGQIRINCLCQSEAA